jgi:hypothetical protein
VSRSVFIQIGENPDNRECSEFVENFRKSPGIGHKIPVAFHEYNRR